MWKYNDTDSMYDTLMHHGIRGMKWGVRRYQNKDGSLTSAGRRRQRNNPFFIKRSKAKKQKESNNKKQTKNVTKKKNIKDMTNEELRERTTRMNLEKDYMNALKNYSNANKKNASLGKRFVQSLGKDVLLPGIKEGSKQAVTNVGRQMVEDYLKKLTKKK